MIYSFCFLTNTTVYPAVEEWFSVPGRLIDTTQDPPVPEDDYIPGREYPSTEPLHDSTKTVLCLTRTCHQIRSEIIPLYFGSNMFSFGYSKDMYKFIVNIGKEGREALRQLQFAWSFNHPQKHTSKLGDCINLQKLHIGIYRVQMPRLGPLENADIWKWRRHGVNTSKLLYKLPRSVEFKIREVTPHEEVISHFFEGDQRNEWPIYPEEPPDEDAPIHDFNEGLVEEFEARVKETVKEYDRLEAEAVLERQRKAAIEEEVLGRRRNAAVVGEKKRQAARME